MDEKVHIGNFYDESDASFDGLEGIKELKAADASSDKMREFHSKAQWFVDLYDEDYAVDQWGNEWEGETY